MRRVRPHDARHTAATIAIARGVPSKVVSEMLGDKTVAITLDVYSHVTPNMSKQVANVMHEVFGSSRT